jgi:hypothetical protein
LTLNHRAELVGERHAHDPRAGYCVGRLFLAGALTAPHDTSVQGATARAIEEAERRHDVAVEFAALRFRIYGTGAAPSHLGNLIAGMRQAPTTGEGDDKGLAALTAKYHRWCGAAMITPPCGRILAHQVLERAAVYEMPPDNPRDEATLRRVLDVLIAEKDARRKAAPTTPPTDLSAIRTVAAAIDGVFVQIAPNAKKPRRRREPIPAVFSRSDGPDQATLSRAMLRFRAGLVEGRGD